VARGGKPTSDQLRSDPWHIITWLTELRVKRIIIENVWEFIGWGPVDMRTGRPVKSRKGEYFYAWIDTIRRLGFEPEWRQLNAADYGDATTRRRFILMARSDGKRVLWPMPTHVRRGDSLALFPGVKPWRPAREIIDWSIQGRSIFNRKKPLTLKTLARLYAGAVKGRWPEPFLVILRNHMAGQSVDEPLPTITANGTHIGLAQPVIVNLKGQSTAADISAPLPTQTAHAPHLYVAQPFILNRHGDGYGKTRAHSVEAPAPTANCDGGGYLVEPFILSQASGGAPRSIDEPIPTVTTGGNGASHALISPYYGSGSGTTCQSADNPLPTVTSKARFGVVVPVTHTQGRNGARDISEPLPTMTTAKGGEFAVVMPVTHHDASDRVRSADEPLPTLTGANRGELAVVTAAPQFDIRFRMLEPHELAAAMGFNDEDQAYEFAGTKTEKIKQIGNAVAVAMMKSCVSAIMADAAAKPTVELVPAASKVRA
jgi:DNA (cytosine-5)-methyltransferase 1